jgi:hypothetical protein
VSRAGGESAGRSAEREVSRQEGEPSGRFSLLLCASQPWIACLAVRNPISNELFVVKFTTS